MLRNKYILIFLVLILFSGEVLGRTYYVATNGSDTNNGTSLSTPFRTIARGFSVLYAGDTLFIRGGVYNQTGFLGINRSGTSFDNMIYIWAYPPDYEAGNPPILDYRNVVLPSPTNYSGIGIMEQQYIHLKGLTIRNLYQRKTGGYLPQGIGAESCANMIFENMTTHDISGRGTWYFSGAWNPWDGADAPFKSDTTYFINCDAYNLCDSLSSNPGNAADGWKVGGYLGNVIYFIGCRAWDFADDGIDPSGPATRIFEKCWLMSGNKYQAFGMEGNGIKTAAMWDTQIPYLIKDFNYVQVRNCIAAHCIGYGFYNNLEPGVQNNALYENNTAYRCYAGFGDIYVNTTRTSEYYNNIAIYSTSSGQGLDPLYEVAIYRPSIYPNSNNSWISNNQADGWPGWQYNPAVTVTDADFVSVNASELKSPRKPDGSLPDINFLKLASGSDLIDAGVDVGLPYYGSAPDIGYSEHLSGSQTTAIPVYVSSVIQNATPARLEMTYNLSLANIIPATGAFNVTVNSAVRNVNSVSISGTKVYLNLSSPVVFGDIITVAYTKPSVNPLQTSQGGQAATINAQPVTNSISPAIPVYVSSVIQNATPARLEMTYNLSLANIIPATGAFNVTVNSAVRNVNSVSISGTKVYLNLSSPVVFGDIITVAYTKPSVNPLQTSQEGQAATINAQPVTNSISPAIPVYVSSVIQNATPARLEMTYNLSLANIIPATGAFNVTVNSAVRNVNSVSISGTKVYLNLSSPVVFGDIITVAYTKPSVNPLQTSQGGQVATITAQNVTNNVSPAAPVYVSSVVENATPSRLEMTYSLALANIIPGTAAFAVNVNAAPRSLTSVAISGTKILLTLASPVVHGDVVTVAYTKPSVNPLQTVQGGQAATLTMQPVINNCSLTPNLPPSVSITSPTKSTSFVAPATITIDATASDNDGSVVRVEFFNGTVKLGERTASPYSFVWKDVPEGTYTLTASATDNLNSRTVSVPVTVVVEKSAPGVNQLPSVSIKTNGKSQRYKKLDTIVIEAEASDPDGTISQVEFKNGDATLAIVSVPPYLCTISNADTGRYVITAIATDNLGATSASSLLEFIVDPMFDIYSDNVTLYPNPNDGHFAIELLSPLPSFDADNILITDISGKRVCQGTFAEEQLKGEYDISGSAPGTYILLITSGKRIVASKKFIKK